MNNAVKRSGIRINNAVKEMLVLYGTGNMFAKTVNIQRGGAHSAGRLDKYAQRRKKNRQMKQETKRRDRQRREQRRRGR